MLVSSACLLASAAKEVTTVPSDQFNILPGYFAKDGKSMVYFEDVENSDDSRVGKFSIYDEDFSLVKSFVTLPIPDYVSEHYSQSRYEGYMTVDSIALQHVNWGDVLEINGESYDLSIERVQSYVYAIYGKGEIATLVSSDNTYQVVALSYYEEEKYGKKFPNDFYQESYGRWYHNTADYGNATIYGPFGDWGRQEGWSHNEGYIISVYNYVDQNDSEMNLTRGVFSDDCCYILPISEKESTYEEKEYPGVPGWIYYKKWDVTYRTVGYQVYNSSNEEVARIDLPKGFDGNSWTLNLLKLGGNLYIVADAENIEEGKDYSIVYRLDSNNSVSLVTMAPTSKVSPRNPRRGENVTVSLDSSVGEGSMVQVVSTSGQTMLNTKIPAGQTQLDINTSGFNQGVYVVTVSSNGSSKEAAKIIVR